MSDSSSIDLEERGAGNGCWQDDLRENEKLDLTDEMDVDVDKHGVSKSSWKDLFGCKMRVMERRKDALRFWKTVDTECDMLGVGQGAATIFLSVAGASRTWTRLEVEKNILCVYV